MYRAGLLTGRLYDRLLDERTALESPLMFTAAIYASALAQAAAAGQFDEPSVERVIEEHTAACIRVGWKDAQLGAEDELAFYRWLVDELGLPLTDEAIARYAQMRRRRLARAESDPRFRPGRRA